MTTSARALLFTALATAFACASEVQDDPAAEDASTSGNSRGGASNIPSKLPTAGTTVAQPTAGATSKPPNGGATSTGGKTTGGQAGNSAAGSSSSSGGTSHAGSGGVSAGGPNQPTQCDETNATVLEGMSSNVKVAGNACLKMTLPAEQTWIKKVTLQPDGGTYPLPFTWSNCGTNSNGVLTANYANATLTPVVTTCPIFVQLTGTGASLNIQWWGG